MKKSIISKYLRITQKSFYFCGKTFSLFYWKVAHFAIELVIIMACFCWKTLIVMIDILHSNDERFSLNLLFDKVLMHAITRWIFAFFAKILWNRLSGNIFTSIEKCKFENKISLFMFDIHLKLNLWLFEYEICPQSQW